MNTKLLMIASSVFMGIIGVAATFLPHEILNSMGMASSQPLLLVVQVMGAMYFAFAIQNWMARYNLVGGIYGKPISIGNFAHFGIGALALVRGLSFNFNSTTLWSVTVFYVILALLFGYVFSTNSKKR